MIEGADFKARVAYLDHNATAPVRPEAAEILTKVLVACGNPSSVHGPGRAARQAIEAARGEVAALVGVKPSEVIFTASGTEANNQVLRATGRNRVIVSAIEHDSVIKPRPDAAVTPVNADGIVNLDALEALLAADKTPALVSLMHANNETGVVQPVAEAASLCRRHGALIHCDAVQAVGRVPVDVAALGVDYLTISAHKIGGAPGAGALVAREGAPLEALIRGGGQERSLRAGTENAPSIAAFGVAARLARVPRTDVAPLRDAMEERLLAACPEARIFGRGMPRLPNTTQIAMPGVSSETQVIALDLDGVAVSAGSACSSGRVEPNRVLLAMGVDEATASNAIRISLGWTTTEEDIDRLVASWRALYLRAARKAA
jgi:cysteine desulfurase